MTAVPNKFGIDFQHRSCDVDGVKLHYVFGGPALGSAPVMLLVHGFPQNWWAWRHVMPDLARDYTLVVPDLRGIGLSDRPATGYAKRALAADLHFLLEQLGAQTPHIVGHDIGAMVAYAYATRFDARTLTILDAPIPGVGDWDQVISNPLVWHVAFHQKLHLPEALVCGGREHLYVSSFIADHVHIRGAVSASDMAEYTAAYSLPGAFRAAMDMYRQFPQDAADNKAAGRLAADLRVLALGADRRWGLKVLDRIGTVTANVEGGCVSDCGHFIPEEQPAALVERLRAFCG